MVGLRGPCRCCPVSRSVGRSVSRSAVLWYAVSAGSNHAKPTRAPSPSVPFLPSPRGRACLWMCCVCRHLHADGQELMFLTSPHFTLPRGEERKGRGQRDDCRQSQRPPVSFAAANAPLVPTYLHTYIHTYLGTACRIRYCLPAYTKMLDAERVGVTYGST